MENKKIKISLVNYTNTIPFLFGLNKFFSSKEIEIHPDSPADCAKKIEKGETDIGLIPVAALRKINSFNIISDFCIGAEKKVDSVLLCSEKPLSEIKEILLDYQSRTSIELVKILCSEYWKISPDFKPAEPGYETQIKGETAGVIIGDRTFNLKDNFQFKYDLAEEWNALTGLPFVFACWISTKKLTAEFVKKFNDALSYGTSHIQKAIIQTGTGSLNEQDCLFYLSKRISFEFNDAKKEALNKFLSKIE